MDKGTLGRKRVAMVAIGVQRGFGQNGAAAGALKRQLQAVRQRPRKAHYAARDQKER